MQGGIGVRYAIKRSLYRYSCVLVPLPHHTAFVAYQAMIGMIRSSMPERANSADAAVGHLEQQAEHSEQLAPQLSTALDSETNDFPKWLAPENGGR